MASVRDTKLKVGCTKGLRGEMVLRIRKHDFTAG